MSPLILFTIGIVLIVLGSRSRKRTGCVRGNGIIAPEMNPAQ